MYQEIDSCEVTFYFQKCFYCKTLRLVRLIFINGCQNKLSSDFSRCLKLSESIFHTDLYFRCKDGSPTAPLYKVLMTEHNRIAGELYTLNPFWDDTKLFLETRRAIAAIIQHITYNEFLPVLLGEVSNTEHTILYF